MERGRPRYLSNVPALDRPQGLRAFFWSPWAWLFSAGLASLNAVARSRSSSADLVPVVLGAVLFITLPAVILTWQAGRNAKMPARQLVIWNERLFMMYPRTFHPEGVPGEPKRVGFKHKQPREWINDGVPLASLKVERVWVGDKDRLHEANPRLLGGDAEAQTHQLDLSDGRGVVSLCKCEAPDLQLLSVMLALNAGVGHDRPDPPLWGRPLPPNP